MARFLAFTMNFSGGWVLILDQHIEGQVERKNHEEPQLLNLYLTFITTEHNFNTKCIFMVQCSKA